MKYAPMLALLLVFVLYSPCKGQPKTALPTATSQSQTNDVSTSYWPNMMTRSILQDRKGNIWISCGAGIFRYDGQSFTQVTSQIKSVRFFAALEDRNGNFWFSSVGSGVYYYDGKSFRNFTTKEGLAHNVVTTIYEDKTGTIWFATEAGASRYDGKSFHTYRMTQGLPFIGNSSLNVTTKDGLPYNDLNDVNSIIEDKTGKFWFATGGHAYIYDGKTFAIFSNKDGKPFTNVRTIIEGKKGAIWLGGSDGLWRYEGRSFTNYTANLVGYVYEDKKGNIWISSQRGNEGSWVLSRYEAKSLSTKTPMVTEINPKLRSPITVIFEANDGRIWFGTSGVYRYDGNTFTNFKDKQVQK